MSSREKPDTAGKQPNSGSGGRPGPSGPYGRAGRACPDRLLRLNLRTGVLDLVATSGAEVNDGTDEWDDVLSDEEAEIH